MHMSANLPNVCFLDRKTHQHISVVLQARTRAEVTRVRSLLTCESQERLLKEFVESFDAQTHNVMFTYDLTQMCRL